MGRTLIQKEIIYDTLKSMCTHPTIKELYREVKKKDGNIGQATVYRNINKLYEEGFIRRIDTKNNETRYDADFTDHYHLVCKRCGKIEDIFDDVLFNYIKNLEHVKNIKIDNFELVLNGVCSKCGGKYEKI